MNEVVKRETGVMHEVIKDPAHGQDGWPRVDESSVEFSLMNLSTDLGGTLEEGHPQALASEIY